MRGLSSVRRAVAHARVSSLRDVAEQLDELDPELTIYAYEQPVAELGTPAVVALEPEDGSVPAEADGRVYYLKVSQAQEVVQVWRRWRGGREPTSEDRHEAIRFYAMYDGYLPPSDGRPSTMRRRDRGRRDPPLLTTRRRLFFCLRTLGSGDGPASARRLPSVQST